MKRATLPKRRDRRGGMSPYARHNKASYQYSGAYQSWKHANDCRTKSGAKRLAVG